MSTPAENVFGGGNGFLGLQQTTTPEARSDARRFINRALSDEDQKENQSFDTEIAENAEKAKAALRMAQQRLSQLSISPQQDRMEEAEAWLAPTRTGNFGDTLANVAATKAKVMGQNRALQMLSAQNQANLANRDYDINQQSLSARQRLLQLKEAQDASNARAGLNVLGRPLKSPLGMKGQQWQFKTIDLGGGKHQNMWVNPYTRQEIPAGDPISDSAPINPNLVDMIGTGEYPALTGFALYNPKLNGLGIMAAVKQKYPWYNAQTYHTIQSTQNGFATGEEGKKLASIDRALQHVDVLEKAHTALKNNDIKGLAYLSNELGIQLGTQQQTAAAIYDAIKSTVAGELAQSVIQRSGVHERSERAQNLDRDYKNKTTQGIVDAYKQLMHGQLEGLHQQFLSGMMPGSDYATLPQYQLWRQHVNQLFNSKLTKEARRIWTPASQQAVTYLNQHPESSDSFYQKYGYLPEGFNQSPEPNASQQPQKGPPPSKEALAYLKAHPDTRKAFEEAYPGYEVPGVE